MLSLTTRSSSVRTNNRRTSVQFHLSIDTETLNRLGMSIRVDTTSHISVVIVPSMMQSTDDARALRTLLTPL